MRKTSFRCRFRRGWGASGCDDFFDRNSDESDEEREQTWQQRSENTFRALQTAVRRLGGDPDHLIPTDAFEDILVAHPDTDPNYMNISLNDDEEFARILQNSLDDVHNLD